MFWSHEANPRSANSGFLLSLQLCFLLLIHDLVVFLRSQATSRSYASPIFLHSGNSTRRLRRSNYRDIFRSRFSVAISRTYCARCCSMIRWFSMRLLLIFFLSQQGIKPAVVRRHALKGPRSHVIHFPLLLRTRLPQKIHVPRP